MPYIITENCTGCTACIKRCPTDAITGERKLLHVIDPGALHQLRILRRRLPRRGHLRRRGQPLRDAQARGQAQGLRRPPVVRRLRVVRLGVPLRRARDVDPQEQPPLQGGRGDRQEVRRAAPSASSTAPTTPSTSSTATPTRPRPRTSATPATKRRSARARPRPPPPRTRRRRERRGGGGRPAGQAGHGGGTPTPPPKRKRRRRRPEAEPPSEALAAEATPTDDADDEPAGSEPDERLPAFARAWPRDATLDALVAAFEAGDYARVRREAPDLARQTEDDAVRRAARELRRRLDPDPVAVYMLMAAAALLVFLASWYGLHPHSSP